MKTYEIREKYLNFFKKYNHEIIGSASLLPDNDPTTLFTGSGMQPIVPYLLGEVHSSGRRLTNSQKCFRSQDIDEVGDNRHTTFFEMLGNWSLGDYFKTQQIPWVFEFLTKELGLDPNRLYVTVFRGNKKLGIERDVVSVLLWKDAFSSVGIEAVDIDNSEINGLQGGKIFYYDESKNWWSRYGMPEKMPSGEPGGPDTEMFWDFGEDLGVHEKSKYKDNICHVNCDCGRFLEIGNSVFMEYVRTEKGFKSLPSKNVDFGGGLERIVAAENNVSDIFKIDVFNEAIDVLEGKSGLRYDENTEIKKAFRVILDHVRAATFLINDNAYPSNKDQGYFVRRLIRRAVRFGKKLGIDNEFCGLVAEKFIEKYKVHYSDLEINRVNILEKLVDEEKKFAKTLIKGEKEFVDMFEKNNGISGKDAFILYSTYGFPLELTQELAEEKGQLVDKDVFIKEFRKHQDLSRAGSTQKFVGGLADDAKETVRLHTATHMLHQALRTILGDHVVQKGSNITQKRLRFDFTHPQKITKEEIKKVEDLVNVNIKKDLIVEYQMYDIKDAKSSGAIGVFDDKYAQLGGKIKVYNIGSESEGVCFSKEVCGGPHVKRTGELGKFSIKKEESSSSGIRRIKAILEQN